MEKRVLIVQAMMKQYRVPFFDGLYKALQQEGIELRVAYGNPPASEERKQDNVELGEPCGRKIRNRWLVGERFLLQSMFGEVRRADLVIVEQASRNLMNYILFLLSAIGLKKVAYWGHGYNRSTGIQGSISERLKRRLVNRVDWWFAYTPGTAEYLRGCGVPEEIITTVFNSVDTKGFKDALDAVTPSVLMDAKKALGMDEGKKIGLYCGALNREKHIGFLLKAAARIKETLPEFELLVIGGGSEEGDVKEAAQAHSWIHYLGPRFGHEKAPYFRLAHVSLHPGAVGLAILDNFVAGLPTITTNIPGHGPEIDYLEEGANGLMIPHDPERYAEEVVRVLGDEARLAGMRGNALESGKRYSIETMVEYFKNGIVNCLSLRSKRAPGKDDMRKSSIGIIVFVTIAIGAVLWGGVGGGMSTLNAMPDSLSPSEKPIPAGYFGLHIHRALAGTPWPPVKFGTWRLWDTYTAWPWLEPNKGEWHFDKLDKFIGLAEKQKVEIVLVLGLSPAWASARPAEKCSYAPGFAAEPGNIDDWRNYVRTVATRYKGRIHYYEMWNEPNLKGFYTGSMTRLLELVREAHRVLKEVDPSVLVISPSATSGMKGIVWLDEFLSRGGGEYVDIIGYHFYVSPGPPEDMTPLVMKVKETMGKHKVADKPLWNTEAGWFIENKNTTVKAEGSGFRGKVLKEEEATAYLARSYILNWAGGVTRFFWYAWDNRLMGLTEADGKTLKVPATAYGAVYDWLAGARMTTCSSGRNGTWTCELVRDEGYRGWILWAPEGKHPFIPPAEWGVKQVRDLKGGKSKLPGGGTVEIGPTPILLENQRK